MKIKKLQTVNSNQRKISQEHEFDLSTKIQELENDLQLAKIKLEREEKLRAALESKATTERSILVEKDANITSLTRELESRRADLVSLNNKLNFYERENLALVTKNEALLKGNQHQSHQPGQLASGMHGGLGHSANKENIDASTSPRDKIFTLDNSNLADMKITSLQNTNEVLEKRLHLATKKVEELMLSGSQKSTLQDKVERLTNQYQKKVTELGNLLGLGGH